MSLEVQQCQEEEGMREVSIQAWLQHTLPSGSEDVTWEIHASVFPSVNGSSDGASLDPTLVVAPCPKGTLILCAAAHNHFSLLHANGLPRPCAKAGRASPGGLVVLGPGRQNLPSRDPSQGSRKRQDPELERGHTTRRCESSHEVPTFWSLTQQLFLPWMPSLNPSQKGSFQG